MDIIINVLGAVLMALLAFRTVQIWTMKSAISDAIDRKNTTSVLNSKTQEIEDTVERDRVTPDTIREFETRFNRVCSWYDSLAQLISVFPLLGILGTVSGLMAQMGAGDIKEMLSALNLALSTTYYGLMWAIVLKIFTSLIPDRLISEALVSIEDYGKKLSNALAFNNIS